MKNIRYSLRVLSRLLSYPDVTLREQLPALIDALEGEDAVPSARRAELRALATELGRLDPYEAESRYVETFDRGRNTSLHLFEHVHGDSRDRGPAMVDLCKTYEQGGLFLGAEELPDHLGVVLEFASSQTPAVARQFLGEMAHILNALFSALMERGSPYAAVIAAVLELTGEKVQAVPVPTEESIDESWTEPPAFDGCSTRGQARPGDPQPIHIVRKSAASHGVVA